MQSILGKILNYLSTSPGKREPLEMARNCSSKLLEGNMTDKIEYVRRLLISRYFPYCCWYFREKVRFTV